MTYSRESVEGRFLAGDPMAIGIVSRWVAIVLGSTSFRRLGDERRELHQETMVRVFVSLNEGRFDPRRDLRVYVQAITRYAAQRALLDLHEEPRSNDEEASMEPDSEGREPDPTIRVLVDEILALLPERCRTLISQYFFDNKSQEEIAIELGVPIGTVKSRLFRCLETAQEVVQCRKARQP